MKNGRWLLNRQKPYNAVVSGQCEEAEISISTFDCMLAVPAVHYSDGEMVEVDLIAKLELNANRQPNCVKLIALVAWHAKALKRHTATSKKKPRRGKKLQKNAADKKFAKRFVSVSACNLIRL